MQIKDSNSIFSTYKKLINYRKNNKLIVFGEYELLETADDIFAYIRFNSEESILVVTNISEQVNVFTYLENMKLGDLVITNYPNENVYLSSIELKPYMAYAIKI